MFHLGYNTNGLCHHRTADALQLLAELGYEAVALTPDAGRLDPYDLRPGEVADTRTRAEDLGLELCVETGARYLLDPRRKHFPTLLESEAGDRARRVDFLRRSIDLAADLGAPVVSFWSGAAPDGERAGASGADAAHEALWERLCSGVAQVAAHARERGVQLAFEPEPGMFIERPLEYGRLLERSGLAPGDLGLCLDVGHLLCTGDLPVQDAIREWSGHLTMVHLDDIKDGVHVHRMFGEGDLDLRATLAALIEARYTGLACVELSRDGHRGAQAAQEARQKLLAAWPED